MHVQTGLACSVKLGDLVRIKKETRGREDFGGKIGLIVKNHYLIQTIKVFVDNVTIALLTDEVELIENE